MRVKLYVDNLVLLDLRKLRIVDTLELQEVSKKENGERKKERETTSHAYHVK